MCKEIIEKDLSFEKGVKKTNVDLESKSITVIYNSEKTDPDKIRLAITKTGYDADSIPGDQKAYSRLPECCKKEKETH
jgi:copper chaperone CopZ